MKLAARRSSSGGRFGLQDCLATGPGSAILGSLLFSALFLSPMSAKFLLRVAGTLLLAWAAAAACVALHTPLPWMLGPLVATSVLSMAGAPTESWGPLRNGGLLVPFHQRRAGKTDK